MIKMKKISYLIFIIFILIAFIVLIPSVEAKEIDISNLESYKEIEVNEGDKIMMVIKEMMCLAFQL